MKIRLLLFTLMLLIGSSHLIGQTSFNGFALYNELGSNTSYLIDKDGNIAHNWSCAESGNYAVKLTDNGNIVRGASYSGNILTGAAIGGLIQELDASANVVWEYIYSDASHCSHHDFCLMPNGNVILTAWEVKTGSEMDASGSTASDESWPTHFVELQPDGAGSANIIWEWHMWDHLIQDHDSTKANYGVVADNPQLMDINAVPKFSNDGFFGYDWFHVNGINYNESLDQLVFTSRMGSEFYIIDHSTTSAEAATNSGGNSGMGGDLLYRWGNPANYGAPGTQMIPAAVHDPQWVKPGRPYAGYIQFFNNEGVNSNSSSVDLILAPESGNTYSWTPGTSYAPTTFTKRHNAVAFSSGQSASDRMSNGNVFVAVSGEYMYEVDSNDNMVWQYNAGPAKAFRYECDHVGLTALLGADPCNLVSVGELDDKDISIYPNPSKGMFNITGIELNTEMEIRVYDAFGSLVLVSQNTNSVNLQDQPNGFYMVNVILEGTKLFRKKIVLMK
ncbi:MAG: hypothetical protein ACI9J3_003866 [Parvicellaceae bacterium]|jgi:hypothetical protein